MAIVDWDLPGIEGPEMCRLVRDFHHGHDTWLVVLAGSDHRATGEAWRAGADDCVSTPAPAADLRACVEKGLRAMRAPWTPVDEADMEPESRGRAPRSTPCARPTTAAATTSSASAARSCGLRRSRATTA